MPAVLAKDFAPCGLGDDSPVMWCKRPITELRTLDLSLPAGSVLRQVARPTPSPDDRLVLRVNAVRQGPVFLLH